MEMGPKEELPFSLTRQRVCMTDAPAHSHLIEMGPEEELSFSATRQRVSSGSCNFNPQTTCGDSTSGMEGLPFSCHLGEEFLGCNLQFQPTDKF